MSDIIKIYGALSRWEQGSFVPIPFDGGVTYGGHQKWLTTLGIRSFYADRSCSVTAVTNLLIYMSQNHPKTFGFFGMEALTKEAYNAMQFEVYQCLRPKLWGVPTLSKVASVVERLSSAKGRALSTAKTEMAWTFENVRAFLVEGLSQDCPVLMVSWNSKIPDLALHWVTVTCVFESASGTQFVTSNWAKCRTYDLKKWVEEDSLYKAVIYFK